VGGFFGGGRQTRTVVQSQISPAQEEAVRALLPFQLEEAGLQLGLARQGAGMLQSAVGETGAELERALQLSPAERALPEITELQFGPASQLVFGGAEEMFGPVPRSIITPLERAFRETVSPEIQSAALRAGAPGGGVEQDLFTRAAGRFATEAVEALQRGAAERFRTGALLANLAPTLGVAGAREAANLGALERALATQQAEVPVALAQALLGAASGIPLVQVPFAPAGSVTRGRETPTTAAELGSALGTALTLALAIWGAACWIADALYGFGTPRNVAARLWVATRWPRWAQWVYAKVGRWVASKRLLVRALKPLFDWGVRRYAARWT
jgi:hypothetical protein